MDYNIITQGLQIIWDYIDGYGVHPLLIMLTLTLICRTNTQLIAKALSKFNTKNEIKLLINVFIDLLLGISLLAVTRFSLKDIPFLWVQRMGERNMYFSAAVGAIIVLFIFYGFEFSISKIRKVLNSNDFAQVFSILFVSFLITHILVTSEVSTIMYIMGGFAVSKMISPLFPVPEFKKL
jgi:hypothetical protein